MRSRGWERTDVRLELSSFSQPRSGGSSPLEGIPLRIHVDNQPVHVVPSHRMPVDEGKRKRLRAFRRAFPGEGRRHILSFLPEFLRDLLAVLERRRGQSEHVSILPPPSQDDLSNQEILRSILHEVRNAVEFGHTVGLSARFLEFARGYPYLLLKALWVTRDHDGRATTKRSFEE